MLELDVDEVEVGGKATDEATEDKGAEEPRVDDTDDEDIGAGLLMDDATEDTGATELAAGGGVDHPVAGRTAAVGISGAPVRRGARACPLR